MGTATLAQQLESVSELALDALKTILEQPIDPEAPALLRAQTSAAGIALNTQLRADALRLRAARDDKALETLMKLMREKERTTPPGHFEKESCAPLISSLDGPSSLVMANEP